MVKSNCKKIAKTEEEKKIIKRLTATRKRLVNLERDRETRRRIFDEDMERLTAALNRGDFFEHESIGLGIEYSEVAREEINEEIIDKTYEFCYLKKELLILEKERRRRRRTKQILKIRRRMRKEKKQINKEQKKLVVQLRNGQGNKKEIENKQNALFNRWNDLSMIGQMLTRMENSQQQQQENEEQERRRIREERTQFRRRRRIELAGRADERILRRGNIEDRTQDLVRRRRAEEQRQRRRRERWEQIRVQIVEQQQQHERERELLRQMLEQQVQMVREAITEQQHREQVIQFRDLQNYARQQQQRRRNERRELRNIIAEFNQQYPPQQNQQPQRLPEPSNREVIAIPAENGIMIINEFDQVVDINVNQVGDQGFFDINLHERLDFNDNINDRTAASEVPFESQSLLGEDEHYLFYGNK